MNQSPEIESIIERAVLSAKEYKHQYVTIEHLLLALVTHPPFKKCLSNFKVDVDLMISEIEAYLTGLHGIEAREPNIQPRKTNSLERVINRGVTQVILRAESKSLLLMYIFLLPQKVILMHIISC